MAAARRLNFTISFGLPAAMVASAVLFLLVNTIGTTGFMLRSRLPGPWVHWTRATTVESGVSDHRRVAASSSITEAIGRNDFPILETEAHPGKKLVFLDSAASSQKPRFVLDAMDSYYKTSHANVHRGAHALAVKATEKYEDAREQVRQFVNAGGREEIIFTRGATDAINLVAMSWAQRLQPGDEIILSEMEHHSNLVPWQMAAQRTGAVLKVRGAWSVVVTFLRGHVTTLHHTHPSRCLLRALHTLDGPPTPLIDAPHPAPPPVVCPLQFVPMNASMEFDLDKYYALLTDRTKLVLK
jgi:hypothetical protein